MNDAADLTEMISVRLSAADRALLESVTARLPLKMIAVARHALRIGLAALDANPSLILEMKPETKRGSKAKGKGKMR